MSKREPMPVDPRPYDRATAIINFLIIVVISMVIFAGVFGSALAINWALTVIQSGMCK